MSGYIAWVIIVSIFFNVIAAVSLKDYNFFYSTALGFIAATLTEILITLMDIRDGRHG